MKTKQQWYRSIHRDLGYFYVGLIISFSVSGLILNHRDSVDLQNYTIETKAIALASTDSIEQATDAYVKSIAGTFADNPYRGFSVRKGELRVYYEGAFAALDVKTGKGEIEFFRTTPILGHMIQLHKSLNVWWVWFSDIFAVSLLVIAITGILLGKGKYSFRRRGWLLAVAGILFPVVFLLFLY